MKRILAPVITASLLLAAAGVALAHCEIPCGIYGDTTRIDLLFEDIATVEKSMNQIQALSGKTDALSLNQLNRWISNKDDHATKIQDTVTQYFMTQRCKPKSGEDEKRYLTQITSLHAMLIQAMKCKQTVDVAHCAELRGLVRRFSAAYFSAEDMKHINEHHGEGDHK